MIITKRLTGYFVILFFLIGNCSDSIEKENVTDIQGLEIKIPQRIHELDQIDSLYFSYLGMNSFAEENGEFILPIWSSSTLVKVTEDADSILAKTMQGRGPGELQDVGIPTVGKTKVFVYDQFQKKITIYQRDDLSLIDEFLVEPYKDFGIRRVYTAFEDNVVLLELSNSRLEISKMENRLLIKFNKENRSFGKSLAIKGKPYAPLGDLIDGRAGSAIMVPYSNNQFILPIIERSTFLFYDTRTDLIAEVNADFDTLRSIAIDLPVEKVSSADKDSIKVIYDISDEDWKYVEPYIPQTKAKADNMLYHNGKIWLKSNTRQKGDIWFVLNMEGEVIELVRLPENSYLTHISKKHLGVRLDEITFALYSNPTFNTMQ